MKRQPRDQRRHGVGIRLQARDIEVIHALARLRIAPTRDIAELCFPGVRRDTVTARLRLLFDSGYVDVSAPDRTAESLYSLGSRGRALLRAAGETIAPVPRGGLAHHLGIVRTWVGVASAAIPGIRLEVARPDWELRSDFGARGLAVVPDLLAVLSVGEARVALAVEVDLATEPINVIRDKVRAYVELLAAPSGLFGWRDFGLALALADGQRRESFERLLDQEWDGWSLTWVLTTGPNDALRRLAEVLQPPLTASPYGKGRLSSLTAGASTDAFEGNWGPSEE
jgi:hypothetical protein